MRFEAPNTRLFTRCAIADQPDGAVASQPLSAIQAIGRERVGGLAERLELAPGLAVPILPGQGERRGRWSIELELDLNDGLTIEREVTVVSQIHLVRYWGEIAEEGEWLPADCR